MSNFETLKIVSSNSSKEKKVFLTLSVTKNTKGRALPASFNVAINNVLVRAADTGKYPDTKGGDGIYTISGKPTFADPLSTNEVYKISSGQLTPVTSSNTETPRIALNLICTF